MQILNSQVDLVIFDCDGVLVDSEVISCRAHAETLTRHGYPITSDQVLERFLGVSDREARETIEAELGRALPDDFELQMKQAALQRYRRRSEDYSTHRRGDRRDRSRRNAWRRAARRRKFATASPAPGSTIGWRRTFSLPSQVKRGKPAPDLFLFAAGQMQAAPARCLVIEDSLAGIAAAVAAGMTVLGFHGGSHCRPGHGDRLRAAGAAAIFDDMRQLPGLIGRIRAN